MTRASLGLKVGALGFVVAIAFGFAFLQSAKADCSGGENGAGASIPCSTTTATPATPAAESPNCGVLRSNPLFQATASNLTLLTDTECKAYSDLLARFNSTQGSEPNNEGITLLNAKFALHLDTLLSAASAAGFKVMIISGWRDAQHNADVGGAANSNHLTGVAADLSYPDAPGGQTSPTGSFHTCEQASGGSPSYKWIIANDGANGIGTLMQIYKKSYSGECNHVQDTTGAKGTGPGIPGATGAVIASATGSAGSGGTNGTGSTGSSAASDATTGSGSTGGDYGGGSDGTKTAATTQICTTTTTAFGGTPVTTCRTTATNATNSGGLFGGSSGDLMKMMAGMQAGQGLGSLLGNSLNGAANTPAQAVPAPLPPLPPPAPLPTIPTQGGSASNLDALLAALKNPQPATTTPPPPPPPPPTSTSTGPIVTPPSAPSSILSVSPSAGVAPLGVTFSFSWHSFNQDVLDFGDGSSTPFSFPDITCLASSAPCIGTQTAAHTYVNPGIYTANLKDSTGNVLGSASVSVSSHDSLSPSQPTTASSTPATSINTSAIVDALASIRTTIANIIQAIANLFIQNSTSTATSTTP